MKSTGRALAITMAGALFVSGAAPLAHDRITTKVTWTHDISRIVQARCIRCHVEDGPGPMPLMTYEDAKPWAKAMKEETLARRMPKWHAARGYGDFANDPSLSPFEIALIAAWADGGAPLGTPVSNATPTQVTAADMKLSATRGAIRSLTLPCGNRPLSGRLVAVQPLLQQDSDAGISAQLPGGRRRIIAWIRHYETEFPTTYWLRTPMDLPAGSRVVVEATGECQLAVSLAVAR
jgi:hypothetical protein